MLGFMLIRVHRSPRDSVLAQELLDRSGMPGVIPLQIRRQLQKNRAELARLPKWCETFQHGVERREPFRLESPDVCDLTMRLRCVQKSGRCLMVPGLNGLIRR